MKLKNNCFDDSKNVRIVIDDKLILLDRLGLNKKFRDVTVAVNSDVRDKSEPCKAKGSPTDEEKKNISYSEEKSDKVIVSENVVSEEQNDKVIVSENVVSEEKNDKVIVSENVVSEDIASEDVVSEEKNDKVIFSENVVSEDVASEEKHDKVIVSREYEKELIIFEEVPNNNPKKEVVVEETTLAMELCFIANIEQKDTNIPEEKAKEKINVSHGVAETKENKPENDANKFSERKEWDTSSLELLRIRSMPSLMVGLILKTKIRVIVQYFHPKLI